MLPCGTPDSTSTWAEVVPLMMTYCLCSDKFIKFIITCRVYWILLLLLFYFLQHNELLNPINSIHVLALHYYIYLP